MDFDRIHCGFFQNKTGAGFVNWIRNVKAGIEKFYEEVYYSRYRRQALQESRDLDDLFLIMVISEYMGLSNPVQYYTLELTPWLLEEFHEWHLRNDFDHSPLDRFSCC